MAEDCEIFQPIPESVLQRGSLPRLHGNKKPPGAILPPGAGFGEYLTSLV
jgi:hypothetical protein